MEGESPLLKEGGSLPPNLPLSPRTSPMSPPFLKWKFVSLFENGGDMGEVFCVWGGAEFLWGEASRPFCEWELLGDLRKHQNGHIVGNDPCVVPFLFQMIIHAKQVNSYKVLSDRFPPANRVRSRTLQQIPTSQSDKKLPPRAPAKSKANQIYAMQRRVLLGEVLGRSGRFGG